MQQGPEGAETGDTSSSINLALAQVDELKTIHEETTPRTKRHRRRGNPFKVRINSDNLGYMKQLYS